MLQICHVETMPDADVHGNIAIMAMHARDQCEMSAAQLGDAGFEQRTINSCRTLFL